jgi:hypothetical protein
MRQASHALGSSLAGNLSLHVLQVRSTLGHYGNAQPWPSVASTIPLAHGSLAFPLVPLLPGSHWAAAAHTTKPYVEKYSISFVSALVAVVCMCAWLIPSS